MRIILILTFFQITLGLYLQRDVNPKGNKQDLNLLEGDGPCAGKCDRSSSPSSRNEIPHFVLPIIENLPLQGIPEVQADQPEGGTESSYTTLKESDILATTQEPTLLHVKVLTTQPHPQFYHITTPAPTTSSKFRTTSIPNYYPPIREPQPVVVQSYGVPGYSPGQPIYTSRFGYPYGYRRSSRPHFLNHPFQLIRQFFWHNPLQVWGRNYL